MKKCNWKKLQKSKTQLRANKKEPVKNSKKSKNSKNRLKKVPKKLNNTAQDLIKKSCRKNLKNLKK